MNVDTLIDVTRLNEIDSSQDQLLHGFQRQWSKNLPPEVVVQEYESRTESTHGVTSSATLPKNNSEDSSLSERNKYWKNIQAKYFGEVIAVKPDHFVANIYSNLQAVLPDESVDISLSEISADDRKLVQPGSTFYWSLGLKKESSGVIERFSEITFRRTMVWTKSLDDQAAKMGQFLYEKYQPRGE